MDLTPSTTSTEHSPSSDSPSPVYHGRTPSPGAPPLKRRRIGPSDIDPDDDDDDDDPVRISARPGVSADDSLDECGFITLSSDLHDIRKAECHFPSLVPFVNRLDAAYRHRWPTRHNPYSHVSALLIQFQDDDLGVRSEIADLECMFRDTYHFDVDTYRIPSSKKRYHQLSAKLHDFVDDDAPGRLFIIYYGGHAKRDGSSQPIWLSSVLPHSLPRPPHPHSTDCLPLPFQEAR